MTTDHATFLAAIAAAPADPYPRLVYADWLDDRHQHADAAFQRVLAEPDDDRHRLAWADCVEWDQPERAEFVRVQCELAKPDADILPGDDGPLLSLIRRTEARRDALRRRKRELLAPDNYIRWRPTGDYLTWLVPTRAAEHFSRGFVSRLTLTWQDWQAHSAELLAACPIRGAAEGAVRLATWPDEPVIFCPPGTAHDEWERRLAHEWPGVRFELPPPDGIDMACSPDATAITMTWHPGDGSPPVTVPVHLADTFAGRVDG